jgi:protease I
MNALKGVVVAILVADGFEQSELVEPKKTSENEGAKTVIISPVKNKVRGWSKKNWASEIMVDVALEHANPNEYDALLLPGGVMNPDALRMNDKAVLLVKNFVDNKKPIAAICHGPWTLINAKGVSGKTLTSWPSIKEDLINAGANWVDRSVVIDENLVTSRKPGDIPDFNREMIKLFSKK